MESLFKLGVVVRVLDQLTGPLRRMGTAYTGFEKMIQRGKALAVAGAMIAGLGVTTGLAAHRLQRALGSIAAPAVEVEDAMAAMRTVTTSTLGSVERSLEVTRRAAVDWSKSHTDSAAVFLRTSYMMAGAGLNDVQAIEGTRTALRVAKATMADAGGTANTLAILYNNLGDKTADVGQEMGRLGDVLARTQAFFQFENLNQLTEGLKYATPAAIQFKQPVDELNVVLGQLNNAGLQGSQAGTAYAATMRQMLKASKDLGFSLVRNADGGVSFIGTMISIRKQFGDVAQWSDKTKLKFQEAFGDEGLRAVALLTGKTEEMVKAWQDVRGAVGVAADAQKTMESTASSQMQILRNNVDALKVDLAEQLAPTFTEMLPRVKAFVTWLSQFAQAHPGVVRLAVGFLAVAGAVLAILAPVLMVISGMVTLAGYTKTSIGVMGKGLVWFRGTLMRAATGFTPLIAQAWAFTAALLANPITWIVLALVALGAAVYLVWRNWDKLTAYIAAGWAWLGAKFAAGLAFLRGILAGVSGFFRQWGVEILAVILPFIGIPLLIIKHWGSITAWFSNLWTNLKQAAVAGLVGIGQWVMDNIRGLLGWLTGIGGMFSDAGQALWDAFTRGLKAVLMAPVNLVKNAVQRIRDLLPGSDAKEGPLSTLTRSGQAMVTTFAGGMRRAMPVLQPALAGGLDAALQATVGAGPSPAFWMPPPPPPPFDLGSILPPPRPAQDDQGSRVSSEPGYLVVRGAVQLDVGGRSVDLWDLLRRAAEVSGA